MEQDVTIRTFLGLLASGGGVNCVGGRLEFLSRLVLVVRPAAAQVTVVGEGLAACIRAVIEVAEGVLEGRLGLLAERLGPLMPL